MRPHPGCVGTLLLGRPVALPPSLAARWPALGQARWRVGGLPPRLGGWALLRPTAAAITLWRTVFLASDAVLDPELLLHELRHVQQFQEFPGFAFRYLWESLRRGYAANRFEREARAFAASAVHAGNDPSADV